jgi:hypothetical protein
MTPPSRKRLRTKYSPVGTQEDGSSPRPRSSFEIGAPGDDDDDDERRHSSSAIVLPFSRQKNGNEGLRFDAGFTHPRNGGIPEQTLTKTPEFSGRLSWETRLFSWVLFFYTMNTVFFVVPFLVLLSYWLLDLLGPLWIAAPFIFHLCLDLSLVQYIMSANQARQTSRLVIANIQTSDGLSIQGPPTAASDNHPSQCTTRAFLLCVSFIDVLFFGIVYGHFLLPFLIQNIFTDNDGTAILEYSLTKRQFQCLQLMRHVVTTSHTIILVVVIVLTLRDCRSYLCGMALLCRRTRPRNLGNSENVTRSFETDPTIALDEDDDSRNGHLASDEISESERPGLYRHAATSRLRMRLTAVARVLIRFCLLVSWIFFAITLYSFLIHWLPMDSSSLAGLGVFHHHLLGAKAPVDDSNFCDPLDPTECALPFPSFYHAKPDRSTVTGWRVNLRGDVLPPLRSRRNSFFHQHLQSWLAGVQQSSTDSNAHHNSIDPSFLNDLDGFSTMGPMLFYLDGMKEAHEAGASSAKHKAKLCGPSDLESSTTEQSTTLLIDVENRKLVPHSAEIDYLDAAHPMVLVFPAQPLRHNGHYAIAVIDAVDEHGKRLPPSSGLQTLLKESSSLVSSGSGKHTSNMRERRYSKTLLPVLAETVPWYNYTADPDGLQLLFDFPTASAESQLGPIRIVRDLTMDIVSSAEWSGWRSHVRTIRTVGNGDSCRDPNAVLARTIHAELDVPWFLQSRGPGSRASILDPLVLLNGIHNGIGSSKFVLHIPCSVHQAIVSEGSTGKPIRVIMEYGHGLFFSRSEASDHFLLKMAHDEGYLIMAMDWRGMSVYDLPVVAKILLFQPSLFQGRQQMSCSAGIRFIVSASLYIELQDFVTI